MIIPVGRALWPAFFLDAQPDAVDRATRGSIVVPRVKEMKGDEGFDAQSEQYEDLVKAGVIDPKVARSALQNAASIASLLLTTEAVISQIPEPRQQGAMSAGGRPNPDLVMVVFRERRSCGA